MNRRSFITGMAGILASGMAPAAIGSGILMPVRQPIWTGFDLAAPLELNMIPWSPTPYITWADAKALQREYNLRMSRLLDTITGLSPLQCDFDRAFYDGQKWEL